MKKQLMSVIAFSAIFATAYSAETTISITDKALVKDVSRLGVNKPMGLKRVDYRTFEGVSYRQSHIGELHEDGFISYETKYKDKDNGVDVNGWGKMLEGTTATILSGPLQWQKVKISRVEGRDIVKWGQPLKGLSQAFYVFEKKISLPEGKMIPSMGLLLEVYNDTGAIKGGLNSYWSGPVGFNEIVQGDVPSNSNGKNALLMPGSKGKTHVRLHSQKCDWIDTKGSWSIRFKAKIKSGTPSVAVTLTGGQSKSGLIKDIALTSEWKDYEVKYDVPSSEGGRGGIIEVTSGDILIDDIEFYHNGLDPENNTVFSDEAVAVLRNFNPGIIRVLQMGGSTVENMIKPVIQSFAFRSQNGSVFPTDRGSRGGFHSYNTHEFYELAELLKSEPWYNLPGTLHLEEIDLFMEYIGGPAGTKGGDIRIAQGHPKPWTETLGKIHVEFGNEAWNLFGPYACGGFDGPDYWSALIERGKNSEYYKKNVVFHVSGNGWPGYAKPSLDINNADCYTWAPYVIHKMSKTEEALLDSDDKTYKWLFYEGIHYATRMNTRAKSAMEKGIELSIYEINHHITQGDASDDTKNTIVTSLAAGINLINTMLIHMKENHIRNQCFFNFSGNYYNIRLWGGMLQMKKGSELYRPTWLACGAANKVIMGNLMETTHTGENPTFTPLTLKNIKGDKKKGTKPRIELAEEAPLPVIHSYAFKDGKTMGLVVINVDTATSRDVILDFKGDISGSAESWLLTSDKITNNNEPEHDPTVFRTKEDIKDFASGSQFTIPPFSMKVFKWTIK
jgi:hypothetical protein